LDVFLTILSDEGADCAVDVGDKVLENKRTDGLITGIMAFYIRDRKFYKSPINFFFLVVSFSPVLPCRSVVACVSGAEGCTRRGESLS
jgi:hypothetical protein